jgi:predicted nucleic acid-binding protein
LYIHWQRAGRDPRHVLHPWFVQGKLYQCGIIRAEYLRGLRNPEFRSSLEAFFDLIPEIPTDGKLWREATNLAWKLDRSGKVLPLTDVLIASCALRAGALLISPDRHFAGIEGLKWNESLPAP